MQLKIAHSQKKGMMGKTTFSLDIRAEYTEEEKSRINKYDLGGEIIYSSRAAQTHLQNLSGADNVGTALVSRVLLGMNLNISIASLAKGQHIECKDLGELIDSENAIVAACRNVKSWLDVAASFNGQETLIDL
jgi:hypothetical protein